MKKRASDEKEFIVIAVPSVEKARAAMRQGSLKFSQVRTLRSSTRKLVFNSAISVFQVKTDAPHPSA